MTSAPSSLVSLNVIALVSGGKDSIFSLLHCLANNHKVIALANIYPASEKSTSSEAPQDNSLSATWDGDVDSFMYQTAGHNLLPLIAECLGLPLYRQPIFGGAEDASLSYSGHDDDETEALVPLLKRIQDAHPEVNAVTSGAILSTYQRTRVEAVTVRLGLVPLAYLWQYPSLPPPSPGGLLDDMANAGFDVRIIKVASGGLTETLLWSNLMDASTRGKLERAVGRFGGSVLGEGGEFETMVVSGPSELDVYSQSDDEAVDAKNSQGVLRNIINFWKGRIEVADVDRHTVRESNFEGSMFLSFKQGSGRVCNEISAVAESKDSMSPRIFLRLPTIWDRQFQHLLQQIGKALNNIPVSRDPSIGFGRHTKDMQGKSDLESEQFGHDNTKSSSQILNRPMTSSHTADAPNEAKGHDISDAFANLSIEQITIGRLDSICVVANLTGLDGGNTAQDQMARIKQVLLAKLKDMQRSTSSILFTTIILSSMADFAAVNLSYGELFEKPNPPARVTIANALPVGIKLMMSVVVNLSDQVDALHVQSRSYWAPANIGPYSQAISTPMNGTVQAHLVFVAGQIPLVPGSMELLAPRDAHEKTSLDSMALQRTFLRQCCLSLQHLWRIGREMKVNWWTGAIAFIIRGEDQISEATTAWTVWRDVHASDLWEECEDNADNDVDIWHTRHGGMGSLSLAVDEEHHLPDFDMVASVSQETSTLFSDEFMPRNAEDMQALAIPGFFAVEVDGLPRGSDIEWQSLGIARSEVKLMIHSISDGEQTIEVNSCLIGHAQRCVSFISIPLSPGSDSTSISRGVSKAVKWLRNASLPGSDLLITIYTPHIDPVLGLKAHIVPCHTVWGSAGKRLSMGIVAQFKITHGMEGQPFDSREV